ncbi:hypothetical protein Bca101_069607 [Brassica carinata]
MESLPHDVVELILEKLAVKPLMRFKCLSRQGETTIESKYFKQRLLIRDPSALLQVLVVPAHAIDTREMVEDDNPRAQHCTKLKNFISAVRIDPCSDVANALSIPSGEYVRKNETQRN